MDTMEGPSPPRPMALKPKMKRRLSMFEKDLYSHTLKERLGDVSYEVTYTKPCRIEQDSKRKIKYANTYKMQPKNKFCAPAVKLKMEQILQDKIQNMAYDPDICKSLSISLANHIRGEVKNMACDCYKYIVQVIFIEKKDQGSRVCSRSLWNTEWDNCATAKYETNSLISIGLVFASYHE
ncbi:dynein light chain Tctex-type protein 2 [Anomaloglossus baeobatrachus]|uniref:dynein light chain Tctex-type protein 2 n=1 Tax=Anomaloglossus baeobatrachus TaxID=238106 RepID=UPI003F4F7E57